jgi:hypothetical protein
MGKTAESRLKAGLRTRVGSIYGYALKVTKRGASSQEEQAQIRARAALPLLEDRRASITLKKEIPSVGKK